jgi:hypothetical protein
MKYIVGPEGGQVLVDETDKTDQRPVGIVAVARGEVADTEAGDGPEQLLPQGRPAEDAADVGGDVPRLGRNIVLAHAKDVKPATSNTPF